jgi:flagellar biosynthesis/type III secretory pathway protein FliH
MDNIDNSTIQDIIEQTWQRGYEAGYTDGTHEGIESFFKFLMKEFKLSRSQAVRAIEYWVES